jgi:hypothetical protein
MKVLVVRAAFADYSVGTILRDPAEIQAVRDADQAHFCTPTDIEEAFFAPGPVEAAQASGVATGPGAAKSPPAPPAGPAAAASDA